MNLKQLLGVSALLVYFFVLSAGTLRAQQNNAAIVGTVTDASGAVLPGVTVTLTNTATNVAQTTQTSGAGDFVFPMVQVGTYSVKVEMKGFKTFTSSGLTVAAGDRARVDAKMAVGDISQTVEVSGTVAPALQTDTSTIGTLVTSQGVEDLPLNGRNLIKLVQLSSGVTEGSPGSAVQGARPDDRRATSAFSTNGNVDEMNNEQIDGFDNNERIIGSVVVRPAIDAIQEVNVSTNKYDASVGHTPGAVVDIVTKSGTNSYHGSAYEFFRNKVLNTNPNYNFTLALNPITHNCATAAACPAAANPAFRQNQWGGSLGGPIKKDKTFFFVDYEGFSYGTGLAAATYTVPTYCERGLGTSNSPFAAPCPDGGTALGDFSDYPAVSTAGGASGACGTKNQPAYGSASCPYVVVPKSSITPIGLAYFNMFPLPNTNGPGALSSNYTSAPVKTQTTDTYDIRIDQHFSEKNTLFGRLTHNGETTISPNGFPNVYLNPDGTLASAGSGILVDPVVTSYAGPNNEVQNALALTFVHVFTPSLVLNAKAAAFHSSIESWPANQHTNVSTKLGFPCDSTSCVNYADTGVGSSGLARVTVSGQNGTPGYSTIGDTTFIPLLEYDTGFQYMGDLTWTKGSHSIRFGLGFIRRRATIGESSSPQGAFSFNGSYTGVPMADLLEGFSTGQSRNNLFQQYGFRSWEPSAYVQDDWRARSWLTLNIGMRYDIFTPYTEVHGRIATYNQYTGLLQSPALPGIFQSGPTAGVPTLYTDISPRFGFAATLAHNTVLRGGFGLTFYPVNYHSPYFMESPPFVFNESCNLQNEGGTTHSCDTAQYSGGTVGQFSNSAAANYGGCPYSGKACTTGTTFNSGSTVSCAGCTNSNGATAQGGVGGALLAAGLPRPVLDVTLATDPTKYAGASFQSNPSNTAESYDEQFNLQLQKEFRGNVVEIGYVGELGRHSAAFNGSRNWNSGANPTQNAPNGATKPAVVGGNTTAFGFLPGFPYLNTTNINTTISNGSSAYNALQASFVRRFRGGLTVNFNYTWSHAMDNVSSSNCFMSPLTIPQPCWMDLSNGTGPDISSYSLPANTCASEPTMCKQVWGMQPNWGNGGNDVQDNFHWAANYQIPFGKSLTGIEGALAKGWGANVSGSWQTGAEFGLNGYDQIASGRLKNRTVLHWFDYNAFVKPTPGTIAHNTPNQFFGPPQRRLDFSIFKEFPLREQLHMQFRAEVFNLFNSPNFGNPNTSLTFTGSVGGYPNSAPPVTVDSSHTPGAVSSMNGNWNQREIQLALKFLF
ncbi:MAG: carboxypeptidase regulatory-like domain-containing protein [Candidatus Acidiferrales bacterium]